MNKMCSGPKAQKWAGLDILDTSAAAACGQKCFLANSSRHAMRLGHSIESNKPYF
jgi:hypothetical protein